MRQPTDLSADSQTAEDSLKALVSTIVSHLVDNPKSLQIEVVSSQHLIVISVSMTNDETRRIIGRQGRNVTALRTIVKAVGTKLGKRVRLVVADKE